jgi:hypothetical protein
MLQDWKDSDQYLPTEANCMWKNEQKTSLSGFVVLKMSECPLQMTSFQDALQSAETMN